MHNAQSYRAATARRMEQAIRDYITACNAGDAEPVAATCPPDAVHYFPAHTYGDDEPVRGGRAIGEKRARTVQTPGSRLSIGGSILCDPDRHRAAIEFTTERKNSGRIIRAASGTSSTPAPG